MRTDVRVLGSPVKLNPGEHPRSFSLLYLVTLSCFIVNEPREGSGVGARMNRRAILDLNTHRSREQEGERRSV